MRRILLIIALVAFMAGTSQAAMFDFNPLPDGASPSQISAYMTGIQGSAVTVTGSYADDDAWTGNKSTAIRNTSHNNPGNNDMEILFSQGVNRFSGTGYVYNATNGDDWVLKAYSAAYTNNGGTVENPDSGALLGQWVESYGQTAVYGTRWRYDWATGTWYQQTYIRYYRNTGSDTQFTFDLDNLGGAVLFTLSDSGRRDVGMDDLNVSVVPVPGAVLLGMLGLGVAGVRLRKRS